MNGLVVFTVVDIVLLIAGLAVYLFIVGGQLKRVATGLEEQANGSLADEPDDQLEKKAGNQESQAQYRNASANQTPDQKQDACCKKAVGNQNGHINP